MFHQKILEREREREPDSAAQRAEVTERPSFSSRPWAILQIRIDEGKKWRCARSPMAVADLSQKARSEATNGEDSVQQHDDCLEGEAPCTTIQCKVARRRRRGTWSPLYERGGVTDLTSYPLNGKPQHSLLPNLCLSFEPCMFRNTVQRGPNNK